MPVSYTHLDVYKRQGMDLAACEEVEAAMAGRPEVFVRCASEFPFYPAVQQMVKWYREGAFGQIIEARFAIKHSSDMDLSKPINWKRMRAANGEYGCMGDLGIHTQHLPFQMCIRDRATSLCFRASWPASTNMSRRSSPHSPVQPILSFRESPPAGRP